MGLTKQRKKADGDGWLTAEGSDGRVDGLNENIFAMNLIHQSRTRWLDVRELIDGNKILWPSTVLAHLFQSGGIEKNPTNLDNLSRIPGHIYAVFIAGCSNMNNHVSVDLERRALLSRHD